MTAKIVMWILILRSAYEDREAGTVSGVVLALLLILGTAIRIAEPEWQTNLLYDTMIGTGILIFALLTKQKLAGLADAAVLLAVGLAFGESVWYAFAAADLWVIVRSFVMKDREPVHFLPILTIALAVTEVVRWII